MKRLHHLFLLVTLALGVSPAIAQYTTFTASHIQNAAGGLLASGQLCVQPVDNSNHPLIARAGGGTGGAIVTSQACGMVANGVLASGFLVPDTSVTVPANVCFRLTIKDNSQNGVPVYTSPCVQPSSGSAQAYWCTTASGATTCNFDLYNPSSSTQVVMSFGPAGPTGPTGATGSTGPPGLPCSWQGAWTASTAYTAGQCYSNGSYNYLVTSSYTAGSTFGSTDTAHASIYASGGSSSGAVGTTSGVYTYSLTMNNSAQQLNSTPGLINGVILCALSNNLNPVFVGGSTVNTTIGSGGNGEPVYPGYCNPYLVNNANLLYVNSISTTDTVTYAAN